MEETRTVLGADEDEMPDMKDAGGDEVVRGVVMMGQTVTDTVTVSVWVWVWVITLVLQTVEVTAVALVD